MKSAISVIAQFTYLEAVRNRLFGLTVIGLVCLLGITEFAGDLAITESSQIKASFVGAGMRMFAVITVSLFVITSMVREFGDKGFELILALPIPRHAYYAGKFAGFMLLALTILGASGLLLLLYADPGAVLIWMCSLACELVLIVAVSLLCLFSFSNVTVSFMAVLAFYLLSRSIGTIQLLGTTPILESTAFSHRFMLWLTDAIAFVLPDLQRFTRTDWVVYGAAWHELPPVIAQTLIYATLLVAAGLFDLYRRDL